MLLKLVVTLIMLTGLLLTLAPRIPATVVILVGALLYRFITGLSGVPGWVWLSLIFLVVLAEIGGRLLRVWLTRQFSLTNRFSTDSTVANIGGIMVADAILGPALGLIVWELFVGKTLQSKWDTIGKILVRLAVVAVLRFICGLAMIIIIAIFIF